MIRFEDEGVATAGPGASARSGRIVFEDEQDTSRQEAEARAAQDTENQRWLEWAKQRKEERIAAEQNRLAKEREARVGAKKQAEGLKEFEKASVPENKGGGLVAPQGGSTASEGNKGEFWARYRELSGKLGDQTPPLKAGESDPQLQEDWIAAAENRLRKMEPVYARQQADEELGRLAQMVPAEGVVTPYRGELKDIPRMKGSDVVPLLKQGLVQAGPQLLETLAPGLNPNGRLLETPISDRLLKAIEPELSEAARNPQTFWQQAGKATVQSAPSMLPLAVGGKVLQGMGAAGKGLQTAFAVGEGLQAAQQNAVQVAQEIRNAPIEVLKKSAQWAEVYAATPEYLAPEQRDAVARETMAVHRGLAVGGVTVPVTAVLSKLTSAGALGRMLEPNLAQGRLRRVAGSAVSEGLQETGQSATESVWSDVGAGPARPGQTADAILANAIEQGAIGGVSGMAMGAPMGGVAAIPGRQVAENPRQHPGWDLPPAAAVADGAESGPTAPEVVQDWQTGRQGSPEGQAAQDEKAWLWGEPPPPPVKIVFEDEQTPPPVPSGTERVAAEGKPEAAIATKTSEETSPAAARPPTTTELQAVAHEVPVSQIEVDPVLVPQFKRGADPKTGVVPGHELTGQYQRPANPIIVWELKNGRKIVITGRHRFDLARRNGEKTIPSSIVREANGFTRDMAITLDAESNIRDGKGDIDDYATYFEGSPGLTKEKATARGLLGDTKGEAGWHLARSASDDLKALYLAEKISTDATVTIAKSAPNNPDLQRLGMRLALAGQKAEVIEGAMQAAAIKATRSKQPKAVQGDMFADTGLDEEWVRQGKYIAAAKQVISDHITSALGASKRPATAAKMGVQVGDVAAIAERIKILRTELARWKDWRLHPDLVQQVESGGKVPDLVFRGRVGNQGGTEVGLELEAVTLEQLRAETVARVNKEKMAQRLAKPLVGKAIDTTGDLFDQEAAENPLFAAPTPRKSGGVVSVGGQGELGFRAPDAGARSQGEERLEKGWENEKGTYLGETYTGNAEVESRDRRWADRVAKAREDGERAIAATAGNQNLRGGAELFDGLEVDENALAQEDVFDLIDGYSGLGITVVPVRTRNPGGQVPFLGCVDPQSHTIYLADDADGAETCAHEVFHLFGKYTRAGRQMLAPGVIRIDHPVAQIYRKALNGWRAEQGLAPVTDAQLREEIAAEVVAENFLFETSRGSELFETGTPDTYDLLDAVNQDVMDGLCLRYADEIDWIQAGGAQRELGFQGRVLRLANAVVSAPGVGLEFMVRAYHGTPHTFEPEPGAPLGRVKKEKVGTGEGAAAYGWGVLYAAQEKGVAETYAKSITTNDPHGFAVDLLRRRTKQEALDYLEKAAETNKAAHGDARDQEYLAETRRLIETGNVKETGNLYHVELDFDPEDTLDWDKPLSEQSEKVQKALKNDERTRGLFAMGRNAGQPANWLYMQLAVMLRGGLPQNQEAASEYLASLGIKGIRYADEGSRGRTNNIWVVYKEHGDVWGTYTTEAEANAGATEYGGPRNIKYQKVTHNYVVFNESDIRVVGRNGEALTPSEAIEEQEMKFRGRVGARAGVNVRRGTPAVTVATDGTGNGLEKGFREKTEPANDPKFSVLPFEMPEVVELAKELMQGRAPKIKKVLRALKGAAAGVFKGMGPLREIELKADIFTLVQSDEKAALRGQVITDVLGEAGFDVGVLTDEARLEVLRKPEIQNEIEQRYDALLTTKVEEAKKRDPTWALAVLSHEIGHLVDYIPDNTLSRGNILGHIKALKGWTKQAIGEAPGTQEDGLDGRERGALRRLAAKQAEAELGKDADAKALKERTSEVYQGLVKEAFERRGMVTRAEVLAEMNPLIAWWHGTEEIPDYYKDPDEMYADAFSVWMNNPGAFQKRAPATWRLLRNYMEVRPEFADRYQALQRAMQSGQIYKDRVERQLRDWDEAGKAALSIEDAIGAMSKRERRDVVLHAVWRRFGPLYDRMKGKSRDVIEAVDRAIGDMLRHRTQHQRYLIELQEKVLGPLAEKSLTYNDLREYMWHLYVVKEGFDKANPGGWTAQASQRRLDEMQGTLGPDRWAALESARAAFWENRKARVLTLLEQSNVPSKEQVKLLFEREFYQTIQAEKGGVVDPETYSLDTMMAGLFGGRVGPKIYQRIGYLGKARDPLLATVEKDLSLITWAYRNMAKWEAVDFLLETKDEGVREAEYTYNVERKRREPVDRQSARMTTLYLIRDGKVRAFYMGKGLAEEFDAEDPIAMKLAMRWARTASQWVKAGATGANYGFWPFNYWRDIKDFVMNMPGVYSRVFGKHAYIRYMGRARRAAWSLVRGHPNEDAKAALDSMELVPADLVYSHEEGVDSIEKIMLRNGVSAKTIGRAGGPRAAWEKFLYYYTFLGRVGEIEPKIAGMLYLREHQAETGMTEAELRRAVRGRAGSPDFMERAGAAWMMDPVVPFQNAFKEGMKSKWDTWTDPHMSKGEFLYKLFMYSVFPRILKYGVGAAVVAYLAGEKDDKDDGWQKQWMRDYQAMMDAIPEHSHLNYDVVPICWADKERKKVLYIRGPECEFERLVGGSADMIWRSLTGKNDIRDGLQLLNLAGSQLPGVNPLLTPLNITWDYVVNGRNPYDSWLGKEILTPTEMKAGGSAAWKKLGAHVWNDMTFGLLTRFDTQNPYPGEKTRAERVLAWPLVSNLVGRWVKVSNAGEYEKGLRLLAPEEKRRARLLLDAEEAAHEILAGKVRDATNERMQGSEFADAVMAKVTEARLKVLMDPMSNMRRKAGKRMEALLRE